MSLRLLEIRTTFVQLLLLLLGFLLSMETLGIFAWANLFVMPPLTAICVVCMPFLWSRLRVGRVAVTLGLFLIWCLAVSLAGLTFDVLALGAPAERVVAFVKQGMALTGGLCVYLVSRVVFAGQSTTKVMQGWLYGSAPSLLLGLVVALGTATGSEPMADAVGVIRTALLGPNTAGTELGRTSGLSNEPAHFGAYLALVVFPALILLLRNTEVSRRRLFCFAVVAAACFFMTFSATAFMVLASMLLTAFLTMRDVSVGGRLIAVAVSAIAASGLFLFFQENYLSGQISELLNGGVSWIPKVGSTVGPLIMMVDTGNPLGYGLGSTNFRINDVLPDYMVSPIAAVSYESAINLKGVSGRLLAEAGLPGILLFSWIFVRAASSAARGDAALPGVSPLVLVGLAMAMSFGNIGSLAHPIAWVWLALWDSRKSVAHADRRPVSTAQSQLSGVVS